MSAPGDREKLLELEAKKALDLIERARWSDARIQELEEALLSTALWRDNPDDGGPCWCEGMSDRAHDESCEKLRAVAGRLPLAYPDKEEK